MSTIGPIANGVNGIAMRLVAFLLVACSFETAHAREYFVSPQGSDSATAMAPMCISFRDTAMWSRSTKTDADLIWLEGLNAVSHEVCFGTDAEKLPFTVGELGAVVNSYAVSVIRLEIFQTFSDPLVDVIGVLGFNFGNDGVARFAIDQCYQTSTVCQSEHGIALEISEP
jgi:hypothetical protein